MREEMQVQIVEKEQAIVVQEREILRREKELEATVKRQAAASVSMRYRSAAALRTKAEQVAQGESEARRLRGIADADVIKATGSSEAHVIALKGAAEAMWRKADSYKEYNQAAVLQVLVAALPEIAKAVAEPLSKTDRITLVSNAVALRGLSACSRASHLRPSSATHL